jgi:ribosomal protein S18 acetylase RimI-like enzyme
MNVVANLDDVVVDTATVRELNKVAALLVELQSHLKVIDNLGEIAVGRDLEREFVRMLEWRVAFVARYKGEIIGTAVVRITPAEEFLDGFVKHPGPVGEIEYLVVTKKYRARGVGKKLIAAAEKYFKEAGCTKMEISYLTNNVAAINLYTKLGYKPTIGTSQKMIPENF